MEGTLEVTGTAPTAAGKQQVLRVPTTADASILTQSLSAAAPNAIDVSLDPASVPSSAGNRPAQLVKLKMVTEEVVGQLDDGTTFTYWTFNKTVPGPMVRIRVGDTVEMTLANAASSKNIHSIDFHAATGGLGGGAHTQVAPGKSETIRFKALNPGLFVYHCATPSVAHHISSGMYGLILVEPEGGLPKVDREFYVMQSDVYTTHEFGTKGHQEFDGRRMADELPQYYVFNGAVGSLMKEKRLTAKVGETVRIYFGVGGPNKVSSFHVIGEIFDKVYSEASLSTVKKDVQTTLVPAGGATIVEFKVDYPGKYLLVDHALSRAAKGLAGVLEVTGPADDTVYRATAPEAHMAH
jgi:nitrite reductase (NO-forming)